SACDTSSSAICAPVPRWWPGDPGGGTAAPRESSPRPVPLPEVGLTRIQVGTGYDSRIPHTVTDGMRMADSTTTPHAAGFDGLRLRHWKPQRRDDGVLVLEFDRADAPVNAFSQDVLIELADVLERIAIDPPKGVVIASAKASGFIAGADLKEFQEFDRKGTVDAAIRRGQSVFQNLAELPCPTVAAIHGFCMGGGTEISLACRYRVASSDASTRIGLPETQLGIFPGWGGS